ncbi:methyltransferase domain-containing protein [candidate division KSB1 bacterium]|nr:methyltransferase domain-containing protein [candidate division KSB1 bacterium]
MASMQNKPDTACPEFWIQEWERFQRHHKIGCNFRSPEFWNQKAEKYYEDKTGSSNRISRVLDYLERKKILTAGIRILDIGSGPGTFAIPFIERGASVVCVDVSQAMLDQIDARVKPEQKSQLVKKWSSWHDLDLQKDNDCHDFDLVFAHMTPAINSGKELLKMIQASRKWCFLAGWAGNRENQPLDDLHRLFLHEKRKSRHFHFALNVLYTSGIFPELWFQEHEWSKSIPLQDAINYYTDFFSRLTTHSKHNVRTEISDVLKKRNQDGMITKTHRGSIGAMLWSVKGIDFAIKHKGQPPQAC